MGLIWARLDDVEVAILVAVSQRAALDLRRLHRRRYLVLLNLLHVDHAVLVQERLDFRRKRILARHLLTVRSRAQINHALSLIVLHLGNGVLLSEDLSLLAQLNLLVLVFEIVRVESLWREDRSVGIEVAADDTLAWRQLMVGTVTDKIFKLVVGVN